MTDGENYSLPATYDLGDVLVMGFGTGWFFAGAHDLAVLQQSTRLAAIGPWR